MTAPVTIEPAHVVMLRAALTSFPHCESPRPHFGRRNSNFCYQKTRDGRDVDQAVLRARRLRAILAPVYRLAEDTGVPVETILAAIR